VALTQSDVTTSLTQATLLRTSSALRVHVEQKAPLQWNGRQDWTVAISTEDSEVRGNGDSVFWNQPV
jgi:hypothetical protein